MCIECQEMEHMQESATGAESLPVCMGWEQQGTCWAEPTFLPVWCGSPPSLSGRECEDTSSGECCCQQHGLLPFQFCLEKACLFCRGLLEKHQNINPLIYLLISSPTNLCIMLELDTMLSFLYDVKPRQVRLGLEHKYTNKYLLQVFAYGYLRKVA